MPDGVGEECIAVSLKFVDARLIRRDRCHVQVAVGGSGEVAHVFHPAEPGQAFSIDPFEVAPRRHAARLGHVVLLGADSPGHRRVSPVSADDQSRMDSALVGAHAGHAVPVAQQPIHPGAGTHLGSRGAGGLDQQHVQRQAPHAQHRMIGEAVGGGMDPDVVTSYRGTVQRAAPALIRVSSTPSSSRTPAPHG